MASSSLAPPMDATSKRKANTTDNTATVERVNASSDDVDDKDANTTTMTNVENDNNNQLSLSANHQTDQDTNDTNTNDNKQPSVENSEESDDNDDDNDDENDSDDSDDDDNEGTSSGAEEEEGGGGEDDSDDKKDDESEESDSSENDTPNSNKRRRLSPPNDESNEGDDSPPFYGPRLPPSCSSPSEPQDDEDEDEDEEVIVQEVDDTPANDNEDNDHRTIHLPSSSSSPSQPRQEEELFVREVDEYGYPIPPPEMAHTATHAERPPSPNKNIDRDKNNNNRRKQSPEKQSWTVEWHVGRSKHQHTVKMKNGKNVEISPVFPRAVWALLFFSSSAGTGEPSRACLQGRGWLQCRQGSVRIHGYTLTANPASTSNSGTESGQRGQSSNNIDNNVFPFAIPHTGVPYITVEALEPYSVVQLDSWNPQYKRTASFGIESPRIASLSCPTQTPPAWHRVGDNLCRAYHHNPEQKDRHHHGSTPTGTTINQKTLAPFVVAVSGTKGVGKSTLMRYLLHRFLSLPQQQQEEQEDSVTEPMDAEGIASTDAPATTLDNGTNKKFSPSTEESDKASSLEDPNDVGVWLLDADVGQPEFGPPGLVSLTRVEQPLFSPPPHLWDCVLPMRHRRNQRGGKSNPATTISAGIKERETYRLFVGAAHAEPQQTLYLQALRQLRETFNRRVACQSTNRRRTILLINLDGWIKGLGQQVVQALLQETVAPVTHVVSIQGYNPVEKHVFELHPPPPRSMDDQEPHEETIIHVVGPYYDTWTTSVPSGRRTIPVLPYSNNATRLSLPNPLLTAAAWRTFRWLSYFLHVDPDGQGEVLAELLHDPLRKKKSKVKAEPNETQMSRSILSNEKLFGHVPESLASQRPYVVPLDAVQLISDPQLLVTARATLNGVGIARDENLHTWNATIVGLCGSPDQTESTRTKVHVDVHDAMEITDTSAARAVVWPCLGLGLIRSIDRRRRLLYILTPVPANILRERCRILVKPHQSLEIPLELTVAGPNQPFRPYQETFLSDLETKRRVLGMSPLKSFRGIRHRPYDASG